MVVETGKIVARKNVHISENCDAKGSTVQDEMPLRRVVTMPEFGKARIPELSL